MRPPTTPVANARFSTTTTCEEVKIECDGLDDIFVEVWITDPPQGVSPIGTVVIGTGGGGNEFFEKVGVAGGEGIPVIAELRERGFRIVQRKWCGPWVGNERPRGLCSPECPTPTNPKVSVRRSSCRYATLLEWIHKEYHAGGPFCAYGESAGAGEIAYALTQWGQEDKLDVAVLAAGPPYTRLDYFCPPASWPGKPCFPPPGVIEPPPVCQSPPRSTFSLNACCSCPCELHEDSILYPEVRSSYSTRIHTIIGENDREFAVPTFGFYGEITSEKAVQFVPDTRHETYLSAKGRDAVVRAILAGAFARSALPRFPATLSVNGWPRAVLGETMTFSVSGPGSSSGTPGEFEIFYRCRHPRTTPPTPIPGVGWDFLSEGFLPPAVVGHRVPPGDLRFPPRLVGGKLSPDTGTATVQAAVDNVSCAALGAIVALQAVVKDERGTKRFTNMVEVKFRSPLP